MDIQIDSLHYTYPSQVVALRGVTLRFGSGETVALVGQNGSGKTTLAKHLNGLLQPASGQVQVGGWDTRERTVAQLAARVGYVFQNPDDQLFKPTVWAEVLFGPQNLGWPAGRVTAQAEVALQMVGLLSYRSKHPYDLSLSQRKLLALAAVLAMDPPVVVLDEPTTGQDYTGVELVGRLVADLNRQGKTVITITHDMDFCAEHFNRVVALAAGQVLLDGSAREVLSQAEALAQTAVEPPQLMRLAKALKMGKMPRNVEEFVSWLIPAGRTP